MNFNTPKIKICGVTNVDDALACRNLGADYIGLNFCRCSPRCITLPLAQEIILQAPLIHGEYVAVVDDHDDTELLAIHAVTGIRRFQLHGPKSRKAAYDLSTNFSYIQVLHIDADGLCMNPEDQFASYLSADTDYLLFDNIHGGSGRLLNLNTIDYSGSILPVGIAGGINPQNITAIMLSEFSLIDCCSGVENSPRQKNHEAIQQLLSTIHLGNRGHLACN